MDAVTIILTSFFVSTVFYLCLCLLLPSLSTEWHCRTVTLVHALVITLAAGWSSFVSGPCPFTDAGGANTYTHTIIVSVSLGYFLFDFAWCLWFQTEGPIMLLHHMLTILGMSVALATRLYGTAIVATLFGSEFSNPLLQGRWFLKDRGLYHTTYGDVIDVAFVLSFFGMRFGVGSYLLFTYFTNPRTDCLGRFGGVCFYCVSVGFGVGIAQFAFHKLKKASRTSCKTSVLGANTCTDKACDVSTRDRPMRDVDSTVPDKICAPNGTNALASFTRNCEITNVPRLPSDLLRKRPHLSNDVGALGSLGTSGRGESSDDLCSNNLSHRTIKADCGSNVADH